MTPAALDWLFEQRTEYGAGLDAIALFRGADPSAIVDAIQDCEIRTLPAGSVLLQPGEANDTIYVLLPGNWPRTSTVRCLPRAEFRFIRAKTAGKCPR